MKDLSKVKEKFDAQSEEKSINEEIEKAESEVTVFKFNPDVRSLSSLHDILDEIQGIQNRLGKLKTKALKEELRVDLCAADCQNTYDDKFDELMGGLKDDKATKGEKDSKVKQALLSDGTVSYVRYFDAKKLKIKSSIRRIDVLIKITDEMDEKSSRKISLMQLQRELGTLINIKMKKQD